MPTTPDHNRNGVEAAMRGDLSSAEQHFLKAYAINPQNTGILLNICRVMQMQERHQDVISFFEKSHQSTDKKEAMPIQLRYMIAKSATITQNDKLTIELLSTSDDVESQPIDITINLSEAHIRQGQLALAKAILQNGLNQHSRDPSLLTNLAIVESELGNYKRAEILYKKIVEFYPSQFLGHYNLGKFFALLGHNREARECFNCCLDLVPNAPEALEALRDLNIGDQSRSNTKESTGVEACYRAIELESWEDACKLLMKDQHLIEPIRFQAIIAELPIEYQSKFRNPATYQPSDVVYQEQLIPDNANLIPNLIDEIRSAESLVWDRAGKPTRQGFQTHEIFSQDASENIRLLENSLRKSLELYLSKHPSLPIQFNLQEILISGWGVILKEGGYQMRHIHPEAQISGVVYLSVPQQTSSTQTNEGNLVFSTRSPLNISPNTGLVVLFPSYMPHETIPQRCEDQDRICIAFNFN